MQFTFDEAEIMNFYLEEEIKPTRKDFIQKLSNIKEHSEDLELVEVCNSIIIKVGNFNDEKYNSLIADLPVDIITVY